MINKAKKKLRDLLSRGRPDWVRFSRVFRDVAESPVLIPRARAERVVVLAPHPDDEIIGCGGTLLKHCLAGDRVTVIYLTNGARGLDHTAPPSPETAALRRREAERSAALIGIHNLVFWDYPEWDINAGAKFVDRLLGDLEKADPEAVFLPFLLDNHRDHRTVNRIFASAVPRWNKNPEVYAYEVWTPLPAANRLVDISGVVQEKEKAMRMHASQMEHTDYVSATRGLNRFRSLSADGAVRACEAFFFTDARRYASLVKKIHRQHI